MHLNKQYLNIAQALKDRNLKYILPNERSLSEKKLYTLLFQLWSILEKKTKQKSGDRRSEVEEREE